MAAATVLATVVWNGCACTGHVPAYCPNPCPAQNPSLPHASLHPSSTHFHTKNSLQILVCPCEGWRQCLSQAHMSSVKWGCLHAMHLLPFMILANTSSSRFHKIFPSTTSFWDEGNVCHKQTCHPSICPKPFCSAFVNLLFRPLFIYIFNPHEG